MIQSRQELQKERCELVYPNKPSMLGKLGYKMGIYFLIGKGCQSDSYVFSKKQL